jgi:hypothetical protein
MAAHARRVQMARVAEGHIIKDPNIQEAEIGRAALEGTLVRAEAVAAGQKDRVALTTAAAFLTKNLARIGAADHLEATVIAAATQRGVAGLTTLTTRGQAATLGRVAHLDKAALALERAAGTLVLAALQRAAVTVALLLTRDPDHLVIQRALADGVEAMAGRAANTPRSPAAISMLKTRSARRQA